MARRAAPRSERRGRETHRCPDRRRGARSSAAAPRSPRAAVGSPFPRRPPVAAKGRAGHRERRFRPSRGSAETRKRAPAERRRGDPSHRTPRSTRGRRRFRGHRDVAALYRRRPLCRRARPGSGTGTHRGLATAQRPLRGDRSTVPTRRVPRRFGFRFDVDPSRRWGGTGGSRYRREWRTR